MVYDQLAKDLREDLIVPVLIGSAESSNGITRLWKALRHEAPQPAATAAGALGIMIPQLPENLSLPIVIVQHMPPVFTESLARSLDIISKLSVCEAKEGQILEAGMVYIAPGGVHKTPTT